MKIVWTYAAVLCVVTSTSVAERLSLDEVCKLTACRQPKVLVLRLDETHSFEVELPKAPYYYDGFASVASGEALYLEAKVDDGKLVSLTRVPEVKNPSITLSFSLTPLEAPTSSFGTMLEVKNPLAKSLVY